MTIWLPRSFTYIDWLDPEPKGTQSPKLQATIIEYLEGRSVHYGLVYESDRVGIFFNKVSDAVHFKFKMSEWEELYPTIGYKGNSSFDAGMVYAPYIPLQIIRADGSPFTFQSNYNLTVPVPEEDEDE